MALRRRPGDDAKGDFLGGTRSPRPHSTAVRMPSIPFPPHALTRAPGPSGAMPRSTQCLPLRACGARPSGAGLAQHGWPCGENTGITRRAVFSEGRALRVRKYGPDANQGIPFPPDGFTISRWPRGPMPWSSQCLPSRACRARPSAGGSPVRMA